ncbi:MAG: insulinase family protein, partial [Paludibacteraceae bacterium]|nr:insulinase family protein [Paludibacteraceae bacterium]
MKKLLFLLLFILVNTFSVKVQGRISNFYLDNGMRVLLLEDHSQPQIYGAVVVHVGSKNDPVDNTGMAHYLEHLMFKGTDKIGTLDWEKETVHLDSITTLYDILHKTKDETRRKELQMHINRLSNAAAQYAIPNEIDEILSNMGSENVNAFTNYDVTVYHNKFPSNQLEKWLTVYAERFRYPVFRLFQTELEAVYEEYNLNQDYPNMAFYNDFLTTAFSNHPYGRDIIGYPSHLKNPQLSAMQEFFCKYYHPNNMTLVLVGDFQESEIQQLLPNTMGKIHNDLANDSVINNVQRMNTRINQVIEPLKEKYIKTVKETSNKMGVLSYQIPGTDHKESIYLELLSKLLNNESNTGILDKIGNSQIILAAESKVKQNLESGLFTIFYAPKAVGQSFEEAERYILSSVDSLCKGKFSDNLFQAVKMEYLRKYVTDKETLSGNFNIVLGLAVKEIPIDDYEQRENIVRGITKNDLVSIANKYLNNNYLILRSD